ncbi:MAG: TonB-dependent receptor [Polyangiaceae bacterium]
MTRPRRTLAASAASIPSAACVHIAIALCTHPASAAPPPPASAAPTTAPAPSTTAPAPSTPAPAPSTPAAPTDPEPRTIDVHVIGTNPDALQKIPGSGQLIPAKDIARAQPYDISELLRRVPGLVVRQDQGAGNRLDISVRGLDGTRSRRVLVLEDGVPVANNPYGEPDLYYSPPFERVRGVEIVKGSGSILFGPQTIGGVVQLLTHAPPDARRAYLWMNAGSPGQFELLGRYGDAFGDVRYLAQIFGKRGDGARGERYWATDAFAKLALPLSERGELTAKVGYHEESATTTDLGLTRGMFATDPRRPTLAPFDEARVRRIDGSLTHKLRITPDVDLTTIAYLTSTTRLWRRQDYDRTPQQGVTYERIAGDLTEPNGALYFRDTTSIRDRAYSVFGIEPRLTARFTTGRTAHTLEAGARFLTETASRALRSGESLLSEAGESRTVEDGATTAFAAYVQDRIAFTDHLLVTPGFRFEYASSKRTIRRAVVAGTPRDVTIEGTSSVVAPIPGIGIVAGTPRLHGFAGIHLGFAPPRLTTSIREDGVDEQLDPERAIHYEAGLRARPFRFLRAEATFFLSNFENQIVPVVRDDSTTTDLDNAGRTRHIGAEAAVRAELGRAFSLPLSLDLSASYTALSAKFVFGPNEGNTLPYAPEHTASVVLDTEHPIGLGAQVSWTFISSQFADPENSTESDPTGRKGLLDPYQILDLSLRYTHAPTGLGGALAVKNALDEIYIVSRRPDGIFPAGFRQIIASVRWTYDEPPRTH